MINLQSLSNSSYGIRISHLLGRTLPPPAGHALASSLAWLIAARRDNPQVRAVRANQWVVHDMALGRRELDQAVRAVYQHGGQCIYDMYHYYHNPADLAKKVTLSARAQELAESSRRQYLRAVLVGPHLSNFDLALQALARSGLTTLVLSYPLPTTSYRMQNQERTHYGMEAVPFSVTALRRATERLKSGGTVLTGVERPVASQKYSIQFFGQPALLPVAHIQLALNTGSPVFVIACHMRPDGTYLVDTSEEIPIRALPDRTATLTLNAEVVLEKIEAMIRANPSQWLMYYPVWPQVMEQMP